jgi:hypothetical protein
MTPPPVTLQISLAPSDWRHAHVLLPHQVRAWRGQVAEILLTVDLHRSAGRFATGWTEGREKILALANSIEDARVVPVNYGAEARARVAAEFFGGQPVPEKDFRGGPYYAYFFALAEARHNLVLHADCDMIFGGGSLSWLAEAAAELATQPQVLLTAPLPGPPTANGTLRSQHAHAVPGRLHCHDFSTMSTRLFLLDRKKFRQTMGALTPHRPSWRNTIKARVEGNPPADLPEHLFTEAMQARGFVRREFLGNAPGRWSLHPPYRSANFYAQLETLVQRAEAGDIPEGQRGDHDVNDSLVDWSEAREALQANRWWKRLLRRVRMPTQ